MKIKSVYQFEKWIKYMTRVTAESELGVQLPKMDKKTKVENVDIITQAGNTKPSIVKLP